MSPSSDVQATVTLDAAELARMKAFSDRIHRANRRRRRRHVQGWKPRGKEAVDARYLGYCAEFAFAKFLGVQWREFDVEADHFRKRPDVAGYDVKSTDLVTGKLIVTPLDDDERLCVLVVCREPAFDVCGWYRAGDAKRPAWWRVERKDGGAWYVPRDQLKPVPPLVGFATVTTLDNPAGKYTVDDAGFPDLTEAHKAHVRKILDETAHADREFERDLIERVKQAGAVARGDWRAVLRAAGVEPPNDDEKPT